ncbi:MAG: hypothetical protein R3324_06040, partial [Halobacteriales archaeon]|nr:hypothetical protein [Halobacteriales archaeon]
VVALGDDDQGYVLEDLSGRMKPEEWSRTAIKAYHKWAADRIVAEINQGGDMVESVIRVHDPNIPYRGVRASRGKEIRAEPVSALYEQKKVHHVGIFDFLEDQMCTWQPGDKWSPDRLDALVWGLTDLMVTGTQSFGIPHIVADVDLVRGSHWREADKKIADHRTQIILPGE